MTLELLLLNPLTGVAPGLRSEKRQKGIAVMTGKIPRARRRGRVGENEVLTRTVGQPWYSGLPGVFRSVWAALRANVTELISTLAAIKLGSDLRQPIP